MAIRLTAKPRAFISLRIAVAATLRLASLAYGRLPMLPIVLLCVVVVFFVGQCALAACTHDPLASLAGVRPLFVPYAELCLRKGLHAFLASVRVLGLPEGSLLCGRVRFPALHALHILPMVEIIVLVLRTELWLWQKLSASSTSYSLASFT